MSSMKLIECKSGYAETTVGGNTYAFERDGHGRFVCDVINLVHRACFLSIPDHYREVDRDPPKPDNGLDALDYSEPAEYLGEGDDADDDQGDDAQQAAPPEPEPVAEVPTVETVPTEPEPVAEVPTVETATVAPAAPAKQSARAKKADAK